MSKSDEPAWGERNAVTGYYPQYRLSAGMVIHRLREGTLSWIAVADPKAGRVDDFQIGGEQRVDAYQCKWSRYGGTITFSDLVRASDSSPNLIDQLVDGWRRLRVTYGGQRVVVHLVTNQQPSTSDQPPVGVPAPAPRHLAAFVEQVWKPAHSAANPQEFKVSAVWQTTWEALQRASGLGEAEFREFVRDCELEFGSSLPSSEGLSRRDAEIFEKDLDHVTHKIFATVFDPQQIVHLSREELLNRLGWRDRFEFRNRHSFPVNEVLYQPIDETKEALQRALNELDGGYVCVLGTPGSGKSTLLTQTLRYFPQRVIKYYAYIPDAQGTAVRGEAINFLNDIVRAIEDAGFRPGQSITYPDHDQLRERLYEQLRLLHQDWRETGRTTIILVDGLDHIPREQRPTHSLLRDLPPPDQVPQGIYFVLGSQTDQLSDLPTSVQFAIRQPERRIEMGHLSREAVTRIIEKADLADLLSPEQLNRIYQLSAGHPLALIYLLQELEEVSDEKAVEHVVRNAPPYRGRIEEQYFAHWQQIDEDDELADLLGLVARMRGVVDLQWIESWSPTAVVRRLRRKFGHLFRAEDHNRWYFFHNSFKLYVNERTAQSALGVFDPAKDRTLHHELAVKCSQSSEVRWQWEEIYHLYRAESEDRLLQRARPEFFREQFLNFRSVEAIRTDIILALRAAGRRRDVVSLVRILLSDAEMSQREVNTEQLSLAPLLLSLGEEQAAIEHLRDGQRLLVKPENALTNSVVLIRHGLEKEARQLFDLAEPLEHLSGAKKVNRHGHQEDHYRLKQWAGAAIHFRSIDEVITAIRRVRIEPDHFAREAQVGDDQSIGVIEVDADQAKAEAEADVETLLLQSTMLLRAGSELIEVMRSEDLRQVEEALLEQGAGGEDWWFALRVRGWRAGQAVGDTARAQQLLAETIARIDRAATTDSRRVAIAEGLFRISEDEEQARLWLQGAKPLSLQKVPDFNFSFSTFNHLFRYARMLYTFGDQRRPAEMIPDPPETRHMGWAYFQRGVCTIAKIWALSWRGRTLDRATIRQEIFPLLRLFYHGWRDSKWDSWYSLSKLKGEFYALLVDAVALHGIEPLQALAEDFVREWEGTSRYWSSDAIKEITVALYAAGLSEDWASEQLERVEGLIANDEVLPRVEEEVKQVDAWLALGRFDRARDSLKQSLLDSSSVGSKDYQLGEWIRWMARANKLKPEEAPERIAWFARAVRDLDRNGGPAKDAAYDLLEAAFEWSPRRAVTLFRWLLERGLIYFDDAVRAVLRAALASSVNTSGQVAIMFVDFLLPISDVDNELVNLLIGRIFEKSDEKGTIEFATEFTSALEIYSLPSNRRAWRRSLAKSLQDRGLDISNAGLSEDDSVNKKDRGTNDGFPLKDGSNLTTDEVLERASTLDGLRDLMREEIGSFYHWDEVITNLAPKLENSAELMEVVGFFTTRSFSARTLCTLAERLRELGDADNARQVARYALAASETGGWTVQLGGGTKIAAYKVLTAIDGALARDQAFAHLVEDMTGTFRYPGYTVQNLDEILPLLTAKVPEEELWHEIEPYVHSLFPGAEEDGSDSDLLEALRASPDVDTPVSGLADLLSLHIAHPIHVLSNPAQTALIKLLMQGEQSSIDATRKLMQGSEREQECVLMVLDAASSRDPDIAINFQDELRGFADSPHFAIRIVAQRVCQRIGIALTILRSQSTTLSSLYELSLPPGRESDDVGDESSSRTQFDFLPETDNPYELLKIQLPYFQWLAQQAGLPVENVIQRAAQIVRELTPEDEWAARGEKWLRNRFNAAGLEYAYIRPRATIARRAFFHVVAELADAGQLKGSDLIQMRPTFDYHDPEMFFIRPSARPEFVFPMPGGRHRADDVVSTLVPGGGDGIPLIQTSDELIVLAEYTKIKRLEWETPTVIRQSVISTERANEKEGRYSFFPRTSFCLIEDYSQLSLEQSSASLVIRHEGRMYDSPGPQWMAFNPELARAVGWIPTSEALFGWADENGRLMVWSIWWEDGLYQSQPPKFRDDVGEGWAVVGLPEALETLAKHLGSQLKQYVRVEESHRDNGERKINVRSETLVLDRHILPALG
jgi:hypothetical protein